jgi:hypothetical protein
MEEIKGKTTTWRFPPTTNRSGISRNPHDLKHVVCYKSSLFGNNVLISSDLHSHTFRTLNNIHTRTNIDLSQWDIITLGDMAGDNFFGSDGDPTAFYVELQKVAKSLLIVQGNHDLLPDPNGSAYSKFDTSAFLNNGEVRDTVHGYVGGVNGIISNKQHPYKMPRYMYMKFLKGLNNRGNVDIVATHDAPKFFHNEREYVGDEEIYNVITNRLKPKLFMYGHCHHPCHTVHNGVHFLNADSRIILINPPDDLDINIVQESDIVKPVQSVGSTSYVPVGMIAPTDPISASAKRRQRKKKAHKKKIENTGQ